MDCIGIESILKTLIICGSTVTSRNSNSINFLYLEGVVSKKEQITSEHRRYQYYNLYGAHQRFAIIYGRDETYLFMVTMLL